MLLRTKLELGVGALALVGAGLLGKTLLSEHDSRIQAEAQAKILTQSQQQNQQQIQNLADLIKQVKDDNSKQVSALADTVKSLKTPNDQLAWAVGQLKGQQPISINVPPSPGQSATVSVPQNDIPALVQQVQDCKTCQLNLTSAQQQLTYKDQQMQQLAGQLLDETKIANDWKTAAKGGTTWQRFKKASKWLGIGVLAGAGVVCGSGHCK